MRKLVLWVFALLLAGVMPEAQSDRVSADEILKQLIGKGAKQRDLFIVDERGYTTPETSPHVSIPLLFDRGSAELTPSTTIQLNEAAAALCKMYGRSRRDLGLATQSVSVNEVIRIEGHTCDIGNADDNIRLSQARAEAVRAYLIGKGVDGNALVAKGFGKERPRAPNTSEESRALNRRVDLIRVFRPDAAAEQTILKEIFFNEGTASAATRSISGAVNNRGSASAESQPNNPVPKVLGVDFFARLNAQGNTVTLKNDETSNLHDGDGFRTEVRAIRGCFLTVVLKNASGKIDWLHPKLSLPTSVWFYADDALVLPGPSTSEWYTLAGAKGTEIFYVIASDKPLDDRKSLEGLIDQHGKGLAASHIKNSFGAGFVEVYTLPVDHVQ